jgi:hypothetical protein
VFVRLTVNNNSFWVLQLTRVFTFWNRDSLRVFSRRQASRNKRVGAVSVIDGVGRVATRQQTTNFRWSNSSSSSSEDWCTTGKRAWQGCRSKTVGIVGCKKDRPLTQKMIREYFQKELLSAIQRIRSTAVCVGSATTTRSSLNKVFRCVRFGQQQPASTASDVV